MKIGLSFLPQVQGNAQSTGLDGSGAPARGNEQDDAQDQPHAADDSGWLHTLNTRMGYVAQTFRQLVAGLSAGYHTEHNTDDTHAAIHCTSISERSRTTAMGVWVDATVADATAFTGSGAMTWTVDLSDQANRFTLIGTTMILNVRLDSTTVGGVVSFQLNMRIPGGFTASKSCSATCLIYDASTSAVVGQMRTLAGTTLINFFRFDGGNYTAGANTTSIAGQLAIEVN